MKKTWLFLFFFVSLATFAQTKPMLYFLTDSIKIGTPFRLGLSFRHSVNAEVFFPDTATAFSPFRVLSQENFVTETTPEGSLDSAVYTLVSFDLSPKPSLQLPVWLKIGNDCTAVYSPEKNVPLAFFTKPNAQLQTDISLQTVEQKINYPLLILGVLALCTIALFGFVFFRRTIQKYWQLLQLFNRKREFVNGLKRLQKRFEEEQKPIELEASLVLWKRYLQRLLNQPFTTFTTREIMDTIADESLADALKTLDGAIYGSVVTTHTKEALGVLKNIGLQHYDQVWQQISTA